MLLFTAETAREYVASRGQLAESRDTVAARPLSGAHVWVSGTGSVLRAVAGDWLVTADAGDSWTVTADVFAAGYIRCGAGRYRKRGPVRLARVGVPFVVMTLEGSSVGRAGDGLALGVAGDVWPVPAQVATSRYQLG